MNPQIAEPRLFKAQTRDIGFPVLRLLPQMGVRAVGPFVFLDHMGPARFAAGTTENDVRPHPHIGLGTITYLFSGAMMHRDSLGVVQRIEPGAVNWMCAGSGVAHSERIPEDIREASTEVEGIQMWIALPEAQQEMPPSFRHYAKDEMPHWDDAHAHWQLLIGQWGERVSPVIVPPKAFYATGELAAGACFEFPPHIAERAIYVAHGMLDIDGVPLDAGTLAVLSPESAPKILASTTARIMLLGGAALDGPRHMWWNFVSASRERIEKAAADWESGRFAAVPGEAERIPAPPLNPTPKP